MQLEFTVGDISCVRWSPDDEAGTAPLVLMAHGGGQHKKAPGIVGRAERFVAECGFHVVAMDAPGHGDRPRTAADERNVAALRSAQAAGEPIAPVIEVLHADLAARAVPEWQAVLDHCQKEIGAGPVGFWGIMQGTAIGIPLTAADSRITAAVFGCLGDRALLDPAARITVPVEFLLQWDDELVDRAAGLALFDAFASAEKTLHANAGGHSAVPRFEVDSAVRFFARHLSGPRT